MNLIVAVDENYGIGKGGDLLFHVKKDMAFFREKTLNKVVVMGKNTLLSFPGGNPLKNRTNIVLSSKCDFDPKSAQVCKNLQELADKIKEYDDDDIFIIGGGVVYELLMDYCKRAYITKFQSTKQADTFLMNIDEHPDWILAESSEIFEENNIKFTFNTYINKNPKKF